MNESKINLYSVVTKLVGPIDPVGETNADSVRLDNIKRLTELVGKLIDDLKFVERNADRHEASRKAIGIHSRKFLDGIERI